MSNDNGRTDGSKSVGGSPAFPLDPTPAQAPEFYEFGPFRLEPHERRLLRGSEIVALTPKAFDTIHLLVQNTGHLLEKDELIRMLWPDTFVEEGSLSNNIFLLRKALGDDPQYIETVPKRGYRFIGTVRQLTKTASASQERRSELELASETIPERRRSVSAVDVETIPAKGYRLLDAVELHGPLLPTTPRNKTNLRRWAAGVACLIALAAAFFARPHLAAPNLRNVIRLTHDGKYKANLVTDGVRVYFNTQETNVWHIAQVSVGGGAITDLPNIRDLFISDISQSGSELLLSGADQEDGPLSIFPLPAGPAKRVGRVLTDAAGFSPHADQIAYAQGNEIWIVDREGTKPHRIATVQGFPFFIRWSPDSSRLRFSINAKGEDTIWEIGTDGKGLHQLLTGWNKSPSAEADGSWSRDGKYFIFAALRGGASNLWTIRERDEIWHKVSRVPTQLTSDIVPVWSAAPGPDVGRLFALIGTDRVEVVRYDSRNKQFSPYPYRLSAIHLDFSRDGHWITYSEYPEWTLWRSKVDGTEKLELTPPGLQVMWPTFSPNGRKIAFAGTRVGEDRHIYSISLDGGDFEQLTNGDDEEGPPTWSPDGSTIAFGTFSEDREPIQFVDVSSKHVRSLPGANKLILPQWSIDGKFLVALSGDDRKPYLVDPNSGQATRLADIAMHRLYWSPDSKYIYFTASIEKESAIYRVSITRRRLERIASLGDSIRMVAVAPDGTLLAVRDVSDTDIYALDWNTP